MQFAAEKNEPEQCRAVGPGATIAIIIRIFRLYVRSDSDA